MKRTALYIMMGAVCTCAVAQDLTTEITVDHTIVAEIAEARPMQSMRPAATPPSASPRPLRAAEFTETSAYDPKAVATAPSLAPAMAPKGKYRGYAWAGYFPAYNLGGGVGYRIVDEANTSLDASARFNGSSYHDHSGAPGSRTVADNTLGMQVAASHAFARGAVVKACADYFHAALKAPSIATNNGHQGADCFDFAASVANPSAKVRYSAHLKFNHFGLGKDYYGSLAGASENRFGVDGRISVPMGSPSYRLNIGLGADILNSHGLQWTDVDAAPVAVAPPHATVGIVSIDPSVSFIWRHFGFRVGAKLDVAFGTDGKTVRLAPDVMADWTPSDLFSAYVTFGGGQEFNTLRSLYDYSPYAPSFAVAAPSHTPVAARAGLAAGSARNIRADIHVDYVSTHDVPMIAVVDMAGSTLATQMPVNLSGWSCGASVEYNLRKILTASVRADIYAHSYASGRAFNPDRAQCVLGAHIGARPMEALGLKVEYELRTGREYYYIDALTLGRHAVSMRNVSDLSFKADYAINDAFGLFLHMDNLLCRRQTILPGLTAQGLHGLLGATFRF